MALGVVGIRERLDSVVRQSSLNIEYSTARICFANPIPKEHSRISILLWPLQLTFLDAFVACIGVNFDAHKRGSSTPLPVHYVLDHAALGARYRYPTTRTISRYSLDKPVNESVNLLDT